MFLAVSDRPWVLDGAMVHVSIIGFDDGSEQSRTLNGEAVQQINPDLSSGTDVTRARILRENAGIAFMGDSKGGAFELTDTAAQEMLLRTNPDGRSNRDVIRPWANGKDVNGRPRNRWIIDFGVDCSREEAALYEAPFAHVESLVKPERASNKRQKYRERWWLHAEARPGMRRALHGLQRFLVTVRHAPHRLFTWLPAATLPDSALIVFAIDDDYRFGVLQSMVHLAWAKAQVSQVRDADSGARYTRASAFGKFPFPHPTSQQRSVIAAEAARLHELRQGWLYAPTTTGQESIGRTLTRLYNLRPQWLSDVHERLDGAVLAAYGWPRSAPDEAVVSRLTELNLTREAGAEEDVDDAVIDDQ